MMGLRKSAARRIALVAFSAYAVAMVVLAGVVFYATHAAFSRQLTQNVEQANGALLAQYRVGGLADLTRTIALQHRPGPIALGTALFGPDGRRLAGNLDTKTPAPGWHRITFFDPLEGTDTARAKVTALSGGYLLVVAADVEDLEAIDRAILGIFAVAMVMVLTIGVGGAWALARYLQAKLAVIDDTAAAIVAGDLARRAPVGRHGDEFDRVATSLNLMLDRIAALIANLRQVSVDLAHDLRTPLAGLRNHLERMSQTAQGAAQIGPALDKTDEVLQLFDAILRISEVEEGSLRRAFTRIDLAGFLGELSETLDLLAEDAGKRIETRWQPGLFVLGDRQLLAQVLINLVENALRHTPPGARIEVSVLGDAHHVVLQVRDDGPGIPHSERARVLQRFVRLESSRSTPGHGLGLSLVAAIAAAHDAQLTLGDAAPGLIVTLTFPAKSAL
jgi:signal transduction histidine kinase